MSIDLAGFSSVHENGSAGWWKDLIMHDDRQRGAMLFVGDEEYRQEGVPFIPSPDEMMHMLGVSMGVINSYSRYERNVVLRDMHVDAVVPVEVINVEDVDTEARQLGAVVARQVNSVATARLANTSGDQEVGTAAAHLDEMVERVDVVKPSLVLADGATRLTGAIADFVAGVPTTDTAYEDTGYAGAVQFLAEGDVQEEQVQLFAAGVGDRHGLTSSAVNELVELLRSAPTLRDAFCRLATVLVLPMVPPDVGAVIMAFRRDAVTLRLEGSALLDESQLRSHLPWYGGGDNVGLDRYRRMCAVFCGYAGNRVFIGTQKGGVLTPRGVATQAVLDEVGVSAGFIGKMGYMLCQVCGFLVVKADHDGRCEPERKSSNAMRNAAWVGDALHVLDMRTFALARGTEAVELERYLLQYTTNAAQRAYLKEHYPHLDVPARSDHYMGTVFESMYAGKFRRDYLLRKTGDFADVVCKSVGDMAGAV